MSKEQLIHIILRAEEAKREATPVGTTKFEKLPVVLMYEIARYCPRLLPILVSINNFMEKKVSRDPCFVQTLVEELYDEKDARTFTF